MFPSVKSDQKPRSILQQATLTLTQTQYIDLAIVFNSLIFLMAS